jgi:DNA-binding response OmpR family regulator
MPCESGVQSRGIDTRRLLPYLPFLTGASPGATGKGGCALKRILSIDDDPQILKAFESAIQQKGYEILTSTDPNEVGKLLSENDIDLVMLDVRMPQKSGFDVFRELKKKNKKLKVLFVTAYPKSFSVRNDDMLKMWKQDFADGETDIMYKPFALDVLYQKIEGLIGPAK